MHLNSLLIFRAHVAPRLAAGARILELGADAHPSTYCREAGNPPGWDTADLASEAGVWPVDRSSPRLLMPSEYEIPVPGGCYDVVFSAQVIEHVREIWTWMPELARVTKPGGQVITISPVSWPYHEVPIDCWRLYPEAMAALSTSAGLVVEHAWWGSLEPRPSRRTYPGIGHVGGDRRGWRWRLQRAVGWPMPIAVDMVTVARKPGRG